MALISSDALDNALVNALVRKDEATVQAAITIGGDGCNEIMNFEEILEVLDKKPPGTNVCLASDPADGAIWYYFIGDEAEVLTMLNNIQ
jgi:hypothetical protein